MVEPATRNLGIGLIIGGAVAGGFAAVLFWIGQEEHNVFPSIFGGITALLGVFLIGYGIKKLVA